ncbi:hypothetical protein EVAR_62024_1 [Eumeta japonica]|uniref:Uncharacterized protein n=1 Tax=Eumeta variegata TaxID=151549 RepID=A0A4C1ZDN9_EUMVA|nr:hypothetical protein EVAR_62024_1 [Eumeta japonica]
MAAVGQGWRPHKLVFSFTLTPPTHQKNKITSSKKRKLVVFKFELQSTRFRSRLHCVLDESKSLALRLVELAEASPPRRSAARELLALSKWAPTSERKMIAIFFKHFVKTKQTVGISPDGTPATDARDAIYRIGMSEDASMHLERDPSIPSDARFDFERTLPNISATGRGLRMADKMSSKSYEENDTAPLQMEQSTCS